MTYRHSYDPTGCDCCGNVGRDLMFDGKGFVCAECMNRDGKAVRDLGGVNDD